MEQNSASSTTNYFLYCHFFLDSAKGVIKTLKVLVENFNIHIIELKEKIAKTLERKKDTSSAPFKLIGVKKTIISPYLKDTVKISQFFNNKDDIYCHVELNIQPVKKSTVQAAEEDKLKFKTLSTYSFWEANKQIIKVRVPLKGVENLPKENIKSNFTETSLDVKVYNLNGINYSFAVPRLDAKIVPEKSEAFADKEGNIIIRLRKFKEDDHWSYLFKQKYVGEDE